MLLAWMNGRWDRLSQRRRLVRPFFAQAALEGQVVVLAHPVPIWCSGVESSGKWVLATERTFLLADLLQ